MFTAMKIISVLFDKLHNTEHIDTALITDPNAYVKFFPFSER